MAITWTRSNFELKFGNKEFHSILSFGFMRYSFTKDIFDNLKKTEVTFKMKIMMIMFGSRKVSPKSPEIQDQKPSTKKQLKMNKNYQK